MTSNTAIDNDGTLTVQKGTLLLKGGTANALGATSDGDYLADAGAVLEFQGGSPPVIGATGRLGGAGTIHVNTLDVDMLAGSVLDPAVFQLSGFLRLHGTAPVTLPDLELTGGTIDSDRPIAVGDMDVTAGTLQRDFTLTVQPGGSFTKTTPARCSSPTTAPSAAPTSSSTRTRRWTTGSSAWRAPAPISTCPACTSTRTSRSESTAPAGAFQCGPQFDTLIHLNGPDGHLSRAGAGTTNFNDLDLAGGTLSVASGQTFVFPNTYAQSAGVTEIASGGTLQASPTLTGGVLRGGGQVSGNVTNTSGTVRPGSSPGTLTVTGNYTQGAAGVLEVDVAGTAQGTQHDHLAVGGAAALDGTLAVVQAGGFAPAAHRRVRVPHLRVAHGHVRHAHRRAAAGRQALRARLPRRAGLRRAPARPGRPRDHRLRRPGPRHGHRGHRRPDRRRRRGLRRARAAEPHRGRRGPDPHRPPVGDRGRAELVGHGRRPLDPRPPVGGDGRAELAGHGRRPRDPRPPVGGTSRSTRWTRPATSTSSATGPARSTSARWNGRRRPDARDDRRRDLRARRRLPGRRRELDLAGYEAVTGATAGGPRRSRTPIRKG